ncbi:hypothetical protein OIU34_04760 [Pararhizobium sp. BT-229]|uniref:hypothetical protein n=1 Tax=Pararhizobium sp. BT-229 TaxID=2986923 RepID=UPI0021F6D573|nr:hypothetical protein [Pararhizobium sp. BT-229]MCV9961204.1 hypothetical protein [Pararhizobium sp. BT-229]
MGRKPKFKDYPNVRELKRGKLVFRHPLLGQRSLPGEIGSEEFAAAYEELRLLVANPAATKIVVKKPTFADAFIEVQKSEDWAMYTTDTKAGHQRHAKVFLEARVSPDTMATFGEVEIDTAAEEILPLLRSQVASHSSPYKAKRVAIVIRKLYAAAVERKWCLRNLANDISQRQLPQPKGHTPWPPEYVERFENFHMLGSAARTAFALARFVGSRRGDVALISWNQLRPYRLIDDGTDEVRVVTVIEFWTSKDENNGGNEFVTVVVRPELQEVLDALDRTKGGPSLRRATASRSPRRA